MHSSDDLAEELKVSIYSTIDVLTIIKEAARQVRSQDLSELELEYTDNDKINIKVKVKL